jgi:dTDP-4-amino-4,6-dideoxygalactose transaminase
MGLGAGSFPVTERAAETLLSLPMFPELTEAQVDRIADAIRRFYRG